MRRLKFAGRWLYWLYCDPRKAVAHLRQVARERRISQHEVWIGGCRFFWDYVPGYGWALHDMNASCMAWVQYHQKLKAEPYRGDIYLWRLSDHFKDGAVTSVRGESFEDCMDQVETEVGLAAAECLRHGYVFTSRGRLENVQLMTGRLR